jgi:hypothetical protein
MVKTPAPSRGSGKSREFNYGVASCPTEYLDISQLASLHAGTAKQDLSFAHENTLQHALHIVVAVRPLPAEWFENPAQQNYASCYGIGHQRLLPQ